MKRAPCILLVLTLLVSCDKKETSPQPAKNEIATALAKPGTVILDVRSNEEYAREHVPGAILVPIDDVQAKVEAKIPNKEAPIIVHCASGGRSARAVDKLKKLGYKHIVDAKTPQAVADAKGVALVTGP